MPNPIARAKVYQERAAECVGLSDLATTEETRREYERLAAAYLKLAEAELKLAAEIEANNAKSMKG